MFCRCRSSSDPTRPPQGSRLNTLICRQPNSFYGSPPAGGVASPYWRGAGRSIPAYPCQKQIFSRLTLFAAIGFLLLVPQLRFQDIGAPPPPETLFNQPFVIVKKQAKEFISQASSATKFRATTPVSPEVVRIYLQSIQVVLLALLSAFCFFCTSW